MKPNYDDSFANLGRGLEALTVIYDRAVEETFDAVDNAFRLRPALISPLILSLLTAPIDAGDICENLVQKDTLQIHGRTAASVTMQFDTTAHSICYHFTPSVENLNIVPDHLCIKLGDEKSQQIWLMFDDGHGYPVTDVYTPEKTLQYYNFYLQACRKKGLEI